MNRPSVNTKSTSSYSKRESSPNSFTRLETRQYSKSRQSWITQIQRNEIQKNPNFTLRDAINLDKEKSKRSKRTYKSFQKQQKNKIQERYEGKKSFEPQFEDKSTKKQHKKPKSAKKPELKTISESKPKISLIQWRKEEKKKISDYLQSVKFRNSPTYEKVKSGHKIYPDASKYELVHGINSKASREFRLRHGLNSEYKGKVKK